MIKIDKHSDTIIHFSGGIRVKFEPISGGFTLWVLSDKEARQEGVDIDLSWAKHVAGGIRGDENFIPLEEPALPSR